MASWNRFLASIGPIVWPAALNGTLGVPLSVIKAVAGSGWMVVVVIAMVVRGRTCSIWWKNVRLSFVLLGVVVAWSGATSTAICTWEVPRVDC